jgi:hypothetical protein
VRHEEAAGKRLSTVSGDSMVLLQLKGGKRHVTCDQNQGRSGRGVSSREAAMAAVAAPIPSLPTVERTNGSGDKCRRRWHA